MLLSTCDMKHIHYYFILLAAFMGVAHDGAWAEDIFYLPSHSPLRRPWPYGVKTLALRREGLDLIK